MVKLLHNKIPFALALITGLFLMPIALLGLDLDYYPGDLGDARFNIYILEHGYQTLLGRHEWYWNAPFMYPFENVITLSDNLLGLVPIYSVFRVLGVGTFTAFQFLFIALFALNFTAGYFLFKWLFKNAHAAAIAAFIFAFSISLQSQMAHAQVFARFFIPLAFLFIFKFGKTFHPKYFFLAALCLVGQFYCGIYLGMLTLLPFITVSLILIIWRYKLLFQSIKKIKWWVLILISFGFNAGLLYKLMWPYYERSLVSLPPSYESIFPTIPKIVSYFFAKNGSLLWNGLENIARDIPAWYDHQLFPGVFVYISIIATCFLLIKYKMQNHLELTLVLIIGLITLLFFIRIDDFTLYRYIYKIPGFHSLRSLTRIIGVDLLVFALSAGVLVNYLTQIFPKKKFPVFILILGFIVADNYVRPSNTYRSPKAIAHKRVESLKEKMNHLSPGTLISYEPLELDNSVDVQLDAMLATQALGLICINGYSATSPGAFTPYWVDPNAENRSYWLNSEGIDPNLPVVIK